MKRRGGEEFTEGYETNEPKIPQWEYRIAFNFHELVENKTFVKKTFMDFSLVAPTDGMPNFIEKLSRIATKR